MLRGNRNPAVLRGSPDVHVEVIQAGGLWGTKLDPFAVRAAERPLPNDTLKNLGALELMTKIGRRSDNASLKRTPTNKAFNSIGCVDIINRVEISWSIEVERLICSRS